MEPLGAGAGVARSPSARPSGEALGEGDAESAVPLSEPEPGLESVPVPEPDPVSGVAPPSDEVPSPGETCEGS